MHVWHRAVVVFKILWTKALFDSCKSIFGKYSIFQKCYFSERKMFLCVWLHFKKCFEKYFLVFGLLTFSHIFSVAKRIYNIIHSSIQTQTKPRKKISKSGQIERRRKRERRLGSTRACDRRGASWLWVCVWLGDRTTVKDRRWGELGVTRSELDRCEFWWLSSLLSLALSLLGVTRK